MSRRGLPAALTRRLARPFLIAVLSVASIALSVYLQTTDAAAADRRATVSAAVAIVLLLAVIGILSRRLRAEQLRALRLTADNERLLAASQRGSLTDALTGLRNRRALNRDLGNAASWGEGPIDMVLLLFDLNGFKQYNDAFGHPAGDGLLQRLASSLVRMINGRARCYRVGGDEFCLLAPVDGETGGLEILELARAALRERGEGFEITASYGVVRLPSEAWTADDALRLADQRLYDQKRRRSSFNRQTTEVLRSVLTERRPRRLELAEGVVGAAIATARAMGLPEHEVQRIGLAAELHDIGQTAIPEAILNKVESLTDDEWRLLQGHPVIGERIVRIAPSLAPTAPIVRAVHERFDGSGYPDGLVADEIPAGARIIAVCDAFEAMCSDRPYRPARSIVDALHALRENAGTQFDPVVVEAFCTLH